MLKPVDQEKNPYKNFTKKPKLAKLDLKNGQEFSRQVKPISVIIDLLVRPACVIFTHFTFTVRANFQIKETAQSTKQRLSPFASFFFALDGLLIGFYGSLVFMLCTAGFAVKTLDLLQFLYFCLDFRKSVVLFLFLLVKNVDFGPQRLERRRDEEVLKPIWVRRERALWFRSECEKK